MKSIFTYLFCFAVTAANAVGFYKPGELE